MSAVCVCDCTIAVYSVFTCRNDRGEETTTEKKNSKQRYKLPKSYLSRLNPVYCWPCSCRFIRQCITYGFASKFRTKIQRRWSEAANEGERERERETKLYSNSIHILSSNELHEMCFISTFGIPRTQHRTPHIQQIDKLLCLAVAGATC